MENKITNNYRKLLKKDLTELDNLVTTFEKKVKALRVMTDEMFSALKMDKEKSE